MLKWKNFLEFLGSQKVKAKPKEKWLLAFLEVDILTEVFLKTSLFPLGTRDIYFPTQLVTWGQVRQ